MATKTSACHVELWVLNVIYFWNRQYHAFSYTSFCFLYIADFYASDAVFEKALVLLWY